VQTLSLRNNNVSDEGAKALAAEMLLLDNKINLDLSNNLIGYEGVAALSAWFPLTGHTVDGLKNQAEFFEDYLSEDGANLNHTVDL
jgi:hypothetical protein